MNKGIQGALRLIGLVLLQVLILNHIRIGGYINPYVYPLFVLLLPFSTPGWLLLLAGFTTGLLVDFFMATPGLHAGATLFLAFMRPSVVRLVTGTKEPENANIPNLSSMGGRWFFAYSITLISLHHLFLFVLESFSFIQLGSTILRVLLSIPVTEILILLLVYFFKPSRK
jgi:rod shape-determining protein MreD